MLNRNLSLVVLALVGSPLFAACGGSSEATTDGTPATGTGGSGGGKASGAGNAGASGSKAGAGGSSGSAAGGTGGAKGGASGASGAGGAKGGASGASGAGGSKGGAAGASGGSSGASGGASGAGGSKGGASGSTSGGSSGASGGNAGASGSKGGGAGTGGSTSGAGGSAAGAGGSAAGAGGSAAGAGGSAAGAGGSTSGAGGSAAGAGGSAAGAGGSAAGAGGSAAGSSGTSGASGTSGSAGAGGSVGKCGDGAVNQASEECDDGNQDDTDACLTTCKNAKCGDNIKAASEGCDDGNTDDNDGCSGSCISESCGDLIPQGNEECDDGNQIDDDGCTNACTLPKCGDGIVQVGEQCDDANAADTDACISCVAAKCGDGFVQGGVEDCDDQNASDLDACTNACKAARCGDGHTQTGVEECDDGNPVNGDGCSTACKVSFCGNGSIDAGEQCDGANLNGATCASATGDPNQVGSLGCTSSCAYNTLSCQAACVVQTVEATLTKKPVDIIFVVDNSGSMTLEIIAVQNNINTNFASIIQASGLDYRVILIGKHGNAASQQSICISSPLSGAACSCTSGANPSCSNIPAQPVNTAKFFQYSYEVTSTNSLQAITGRFSVNDEFGLSGGGWKNWLRPQAFKVFVEITDDQSAITAAAFETALFALPGNQFGTAAARNYMFHSIIGMPLKNPASTPYQPAEAKVTPAGTKCSSAVNNGPQYQDLSILTGGLRFPICNTASYDAVFQQIAQGIVSGSTVACDFLIPTGPTIDLTTLKVEYTPGGGGPKQTFDVVPDVASCAPGKVYLDATKVYICPASCAVVQADPAAKVGLAWGCAN